MADQLEPQVSRPTSIRLTEVDALRIEQLRQELGLRSSTELVRYALKVATDKREEARPSPSRETALKALEQWQPEPTDFDGTRARAVVERALRG